jgi:YD repeat-containing protein
MKKGVIFVVLLVLSISIVYAAKEVSIPESYKSGDVVSGGEEVPVVSGERSDQSGETTYYYAGARLLASDNDNTGRKYHYSDRLGNNRLNSEGKKFKSLPFGQVVESSGERFTLTGKELDDSGLYDFGARQYDANNMITGIEMPKGKTLKFAYDALGRRIIKSVINNPVSEVLTVKSTYYSYGLGNSPIIDEVITTNGEVLPEIQEIPSLE